MAGNERASDANSILVIGKTTGHSALLVEALRASHAASEPGYRLLAHQANSLNELRTQAPNIRIDFVVVAADFSDTICLKWLRVILQELPPRLFLRRVVLVNATGLPINSIAVDIDALLKIADEYKIDTMSANVTDLRQCRFLANRLIKYMEDSFGCHSGIPDIHSCLYKNVSNKSR